MSTLRLQPSISTTATIFMRPPALAVIKEERPTSSVPLLLKRLGQSILNVLLSLGLLLVISVAYDAMIGDGPLPVIQPVHTEGQAFLTTTQTLQANATPDTRDLSSTLGLLQAVSPEISTWVENLAAKGHVEFKAPTESVSFYGKHAGTQILAAYRPLNDSLYIGPGFWVLSDAEKAAILAHEYRHSRQNWGKRIRIQLLQLLTQGRFRYASQLEAEAFAYEAQVRQALQ